MMNAEVKILLVEDDDLTRAQLASAISGADGLNLVADVGTAADAKAILRERLLDLVLTDIGLPDGSGLDVIRACNMASRSQPKVMVISVFGDEKSVLAAIAAGAGGYLLKDLDSLQIAQSIRQLLDGQAPISPAIAVHLLKRFRPIDAPAEPLVEQLTDREVDVLKLIARGLTYKEVAARLGLTYNTVASYVKDVYRKLAVNSRGRAVVEAQRRGLID